MQSLFDLASLGIIQVIGLQAEKFLQGQLSINMHDINASHSALAVHCNHKGRVLATLRVLKYHDCFYLITPKVMMAELILILQKYGVFSKIILQDQSDKIIFIGMVSPTLTALLSLFPTLPAQPHEVVSTAEGFIIAMPSDIPKMLIGGSPQFIDQVCSITQTTLQNDSLWNLLEISAGIPTIYPPLAGVFTPHQLNYQLLGAISFTKGCYTGQEIIARTQYLGQLKQQTYRYSLNAHYSPQLGDKLFSRGVEAGRIVNVSTHGKTAQHELLAVMKNEIVKTGYPICCDPENQLVLHPLPLPYGS